MKIKEAIEKGIERVYDPTWAEKNCYIKLPKKINREFGPWLELFSDETQKYMNVETPQKFLISQMIYGIESECEEYKGPISEKE